MNDELIKCPQCGFQAFDPTTITVTTEKAYMKKLNKQFGVFTLTILATALITFTVASLVLPKSSNADKTETNSPTIETVSIEETNTPATETEENVSTAIESTNTPATALNFGCPAQEYGNHSWDTATCLRPSKCYNCGVYKDDKIGNHNWQAATCIEPMICFWCDVYKDEKLGNHEFVYDEDIKEVVCRNCYLLRVEYDTEKES